jgi:hypothetical protein
MKLAVLWHKAKSFLLWVGTKRFGILRLSELRPVHEVLEAYYPYARDLSLVNLYRAASRHIPVDKSILREMEARFSLTPCEHLLVRSMSVLPILIAQRIANRLDC